MISRLLQLIVAPDLVRELEIAQEVQDTLVAHLETAFEVVLELAQELGRDGVAYVQSIGAAFEIQDEIQASIPPIKGLTS